MRVFAACISEHHVHVVPSEARRGYQMSLELELLTVESHHVGAGTEPRPLREQLVPLTAEHSLQLPTFYFYYKIICLVFLLLNL